MALPLGLISKLNRIKDSLNFETLYCFTKVQIKENFNKKVMVAIDPLRDLYVVLVPKYQ